MCERANISVLLDMHQDTWSETFCGEGVPVSNGMYMRYWVHHDGWLMKMSAAMGGRGTGWNQRLSRASREPLSSGCRC
jgi:hypothetical protein